MDSKTALLKKYNRRQRLVTVLPFVALAVLFAVLCLTVQAKGYRLPMYLKILLNEGVVLAIVATGATFIYTLGSFDISLGASTLFSGRAVVAVQRGHPAHAGRLGACLDRISVHRHRLSRH